MEPVVDEPEHAPPWDVSRIVDGLSIALFPNRLGGRQIRKENIDYFVGRTLDVTLRDLATQLELELRFTASGLDSGSKLRERSFAIVGEFANKLAEIRGVPAQRSWGP